MRLLIVEDEPRLAESLAAALTAAGYAVDTAADGGRGDFLAQTEHYDAVVLDLGLPGVDGLTLRGNDGRRGKGGKAASPCRFQQCRRRPCPDDHNPPLLIFRSRQGRRMFAGCSARPR